MLDHTTGQPPTTTMDLASMVTSMLVATTNNQHARRQQQHRSHACFACRTMLLRLLHDGRGVQGTSTRRLFFICRSAWCLRSYRMLLIEVSSPSIMLHWSIIRWDLTYNRTTETYENIYKYCEFQYVPIAKTLEALFTNDEFKRVLRAQSYLRGWCI